MTETNKKEISDMLQILIQLDRERLLLIHSKANQLAAVSETKNHIKPSYTEKYRNSHKLLMIRRLYYEYLK